MQTTSPYPLIPVPEALSIILDRTRPRPPVDLDFRDALGLVLARDVLSEEDLPPRPRSAVDGYAVRAQSTPTSLRVLGEVTAGHLAEVEVGPDSALRIMTGSLLPEGAEAVIMVEDTSERDGLVQLHRPIERGANVHRPGLDLQRGQVVLQAGIRLGPAEIGMLATVGRTRVSVYPRARVAVLATGDELVEPDQQPTEGSIRDSNRFALIAASREAGAEVVWQGHGRDERGLLERLVRQALDQADVLITSGGVSMGTRDLIKPLLADLGQLQFGRINFKPGKPLTFVTIGDKLAFGLPGYPVSSLVTFEVFVRPALLKLQGHAQVLRPRVEAVLEHDLQPDHARLEYQRVRLRWEAGRLLTASTGLQGSSRLASMLGANALLEIQPGPDLLPAGSQVPALITGPLIS